MATNMFSKTIIFFIILTIFQGSNAAISDHLQSDENNADTDAHEKSVTDLELMQNRNQHHRMLNSIQTIRRHSKSKRRMKKRYKCHVCESVECQNLSEDAHSICTNALQCWKSRVRDAYGVETVSRGCTTHHDHIPFYCNNYVHAQTTPSPPTSSSSSSTASTSPKKRDTSGQYNIECCVGDFCNNGTFPELPPLPTDDHEATRISSTRSYIVLAFAMLGAVTALAVIVFVTIYIRRRTDHKRMVPSRIKHDPDTYYAGDELLRVTSAGDSTLREYMQHSMTSGSGGGLPLLIQRTLSKQVSMKNCIGKGRYGGVWRGILHGEFVAVKVFSSRDEDSWKRETEIYSTILLRHENILGYIGSDMTSQNGSTQLLVLTHYYPLGSLYDHLHRTPLTPNGMAIALLSIANGLVHLHSEIFGTEGKPAIAHRDLKSKNILVREDGTCVIADFGLAVMNKPNSPLDVGSNPRVGTKRYMSPEILDQSINLNCFESLRRADIYSFALIMWEVCRRTVSGGTPEEYKMPYQDVVPSDPSFDDMRKVVVLDNYRPSIPNQWISDDLLNGMAKLMRECWHQNPNVRLPSLRIKKTLQKLASTTTKDIKIGYDGEAYV